MKILLKPVLFSIISGICFVTVAAQMNLAPYGTASQLTTYSINEYQYEARLAVEGPANNNWDDGCSSTNKASMSWWGIQFTDLAYLTTIQFYYSKQNEQSLKNFRLYVKNGTVDNSPANALCYTDRNKPNFPSLNQSIECYMLGRNVYMFNRFNPIDRIELCFIAIYGCWNGTWGTACEILCPDECINRHCYPENGSCVWGCNEQRCFHGICDAKTDVCTSGCVPRQGGRHCTFYNTVYNWTAKQSNFFLSSSANVLVDGNTTSCISILSTSSNSYIQIGNESLIVITEVYLFFGDRNPTVGNHKVYCSNTTDSWTDGTMLYNAEYINENIDIFAVCKYIIYIPPIMNGNAKIDICEIEIGGCSYGKYGDSCQLLCPENCIGPCDLKTGNCLSGCSVGWLGEKCDTACGVGKFGDQCLRDCSANCLSTPCDHVTGQCKTGCMKGWEGFNCTAECSNGHFGWNCSETCDGCITNECSHMNGVCKDDSVCKPGYMYGKYCNKTCEAWHFGTNCTKMCYCLNKPCNTFTGECPDDGCQLGWKGVSCDQECTHGYFGLNCVQFCGRCFDHSCNKLNGSCNLSCKDGFMGPLCAIKADSASTDSPVSTQIGIFIGGLVLGALLTFSIMVIINRRRISITQRQKNKTANPKSHEKQYDNLGMETISTYQDLTAHSVSNEYDQINTLYAN